MASKRIPSKRKPPKEKTAVDPAPSQPIGDGVIVKIDAAEGKRVTIPFGATTVNEVPTILRLAAKDVERQLGIE